INKADGSFTEATFEFQAGAPVMSFAIRYDTEGQEYGRIEEWDARIVQEVITELSPERPDNFIFSDADDYLDLPEWEDRGGPFFSAGQQVLLFGGGNDTFEVNDTIGGITINALDGGLRQIVFEGGREVFARDLEAVEVSEGTLLVDIMDFECVDYVYRMYDAAFGRRPDEPGLRFWAELIDDGSVGKLDLPGFFIDSEEYRGLYGTDPSPQEQVTALYNNALRREPEGAGFDYWVGQLQTGELSDEAILFFFAESEENVLRNQPFIEDGLLVA
ncbi:MAG: DUF4214 domain-containing protein, partial [Pseudomonadota bacterium]